jgi:phage terminase large subunit-like protein
MYQQQQPEQKSTIASQLADALADGGYRAKARPEQLPPPGDWNIWMLLAGRGFGKSFSGSSFTNELAETGAAKRIALIGATAGDVRDIMIEGESGILNTAPPWFRPTFEPSKRRVTWPNGAIATAYSSEESDRLRGPNHDCIWGDELASWTDAQAVWDMAQFGLRLGKHPRSIVTTTPRPIKLLKDLLKREGHDVVVTRGSTFDNSENLAPAFLESVKQRYDGTRLGRQELFAEMLSDTPGALWSQSWIDRDRIASLPFGNLQRVVIAIDPAVTSGENSDETGIIAAGVDANGVAYVLEDASGRYQPHEWAAKAIGLYKKYHADRIVAEIDNGGQMVEATLRSIDPNVSYKAIHASRGKVTRAEPVSTLYEQEGRVHHVGTFQALEDQMTAFTSDFSKASAGYSPDRVDACVFALTELVLTKQRPIFLFG